MTSQLGDKVPKFEKIALALIVLVAILVRFWDFSSYAPHFWDEAKYLGEVEGIAPYFSVNVGAFALLKMGYAIVGGSSYPQIVTGVFGVLTVLGCFFLGWRMLRGNKHSAFLGLLMAGQAALLPYVVGYSRQAFPTIFALCFFTWALYFYLIRMQHPAAADPGTASVGLLPRIAGPGLLALVPACSFKFLIPTVLLFLVLEIIVWRSCSQARRGGEAVRQLLTAVDTGILLLVISPPVLALVFGYDGWLGRAIAVSQFHAEIQTLRPAFHFLFPVHLYHLAGPSFIALALAGIFLLLRKGKKDGLSVDQRATIAVAAGFGINLMFFGFFSHLQSARLYVLTLPFLLFVSSFFLLRVWHSRPRYGATVAIVLGLVLFASLGYKSADCLAKSSMLKTASDTAMRVARPGQPVWANATTQAAYNAYYSPQKKMNSPVVKAFLRPQDRHFDRANPPLALVQDGVEVSTLVATLDKNDLLTANGVAGVRSMLQDVWETTRGGERVYAAAENFYTSPYYYLEDLYSWDSYWYIRELMPQARDSIFIYLLNPAQAKPGM